jgi:IrrE N-terminal-like domain
MMAFIDPGLKFIEKHDPIRKESDLFPYLNFLCDEAGILLEPPVDIDKIYNHFEIQSRTQPLWNELQGISDTHLGLVIINQDDSLARQRFTRIHELIEFLFSAQKNLFSIDEKKKEKLCDFGAANLLIPRNYVRTVLNEHGVSMDSASHIAKTCQASFTSSLLQVVSCLTSPSAVIFCREDSTLSGINSMRSLPNYYPRKIRVKWAIRSSKSHFPYIPNNHIIPEESCIHKTHISGGYIASEEILNLGNISKLCKVESKKISIKNEECTISLIQLLD